MKKFFSILIMLVASVTVFAADKNISVFTLDHQMSQACEKKIKSNLRYEKGVSDIDVSLKKNTITIIYSSDKNDAEKLLKAFKRIGFNAVLLSTETIAPKKK